MTAYLVRLVGAKTLEYEVEADSAEGAWMTWKLTHPHTRGHSYSEIEEVRA